MKKLLTLTLIVLTSLLTNAQAAEGTPHLRMATTTSTDNSGLLRVLNPAFERENGIKVDVIAVGTGKALRLGANGDVDIVFVHAPPAEEKFMAAGNGVDRRAVMHNDFVIVGPPADPAGLRTTRDAVAALTRLASSGQTFISRGDDSGTDKKEHHLWQAAGIKPQGPWYLSVGQGMGAVLAIANDKLAYTLTDRGTYISMRSKLALRIVSEGDPRLFNPYHIIAVNPGKYPDIQYRLARRYIDFVTGSEGQRLIGDYRLLGQQLFTPDVIPAP